MYDLSQLENALLAAQVSWASARHQLFDAAEIVIVDQLALEAAKVDLQMGGKIDGKNEAERKAQLSALTQNYADGLALSEKEERKARCWLELRQSELDLMRYRLRIAELAAKQ